MAIHVTVYWPTAISGQALSKEMGEREQNWNLKVGGGIVCRFDKLILTAELQSARTLTVVPQSVFRVCYLCNCILVFI